MTSDAHTPSAIAVPTQCFHRAALNGHNRRAGVSQQVVAQMFPLESKGAAGSKIIVVGIAVALSNGRIGFEAVLWNPCPIPANGKASQQASQDGTVCLVIIGIVSEGFPQ